MLLFAFEGSMLKKIAFLFIIFFSSFSFGQPTLKGTLKGNLSDIELYTRYLNDPNVRPDMRVYWEGEIRELQARNVKLRAEIRGEKSEDKQRQAELRREVARKRDEEEEEVLQSKATQKSKASQRGRRFASPNSGADNYQYSFSGADCKVYAGRGSRRSLLESVMTVSLSIYEAKAPVRRLGHAAPVGFTGNIRSIAGSIICLMRGDSHPLHPVMFSNEQKHVDDENISSPYKQIRGGGNYEWQFQAGLIKPFNLLLLYKNEVGGDVGLQINNIDIISESVVTSVNDIYTEMVFQFVATNVNPISKRPVKKEAEEP